MPFLLISVPRHPTDQIHGDISNLRPSAPAHVTPLWREDVALKTHMRIVSKTPPATDEKKSCDDCHTGHKTAANTKVDSLHQWLVKVLFWPCKLLTRLYHTGVVKGLPLGSVSLTSNRWPGKVRPPARAANNPWAMSCRARVAVPQGLGCASDEVLGRSTPAHTAAVSQPQRKCWSEDAEMVFFLNS